MKYIFKFREASVEPYDERYPETLLPLVAAEYTGLSWTPSNQNCTVTDYSHSLMG